MSDLTIGPNDDGWGDAAAENAARVIKGTLLKFSDWHWTKGKDNNEVEAGISLAALATAAGWVRWHDGKPVEYLMRQPGKKLPERDELGDLDKTKWELDPKGQPKDPVAEHALRLPRRHDQCRSIHLRHLELGRASSCQRSCRANPADALQGPGRVASRRTSRRALDDEIWQKVETVLQGGRLARR